MKPRVFAGVIALALVTLLALAADAHAGTYVVRQCHHSAPQNHGHEGVVSATPNPGPYSISAGPGICAGAGNEYALQIGPNGDALHGQSGLIRFDAVDGTKIVAVAVDARLRNEVGHRARLSMTNAAGLEKVRFGAGTSGPAGFLHYRWPTSGLSATGYDRFTAGLFCDNPGSSCPTSGTGDLSETDIRNLRLTIQDNIPPTVALQGEMVSGGWKRGEVGVVTTATDRGGGIRAHAVSVNGQLAGGSLGLPCHLIAGTTDTSELGPCRGDNQLNDVLNVGTEPFHDGNNTLVACAIDFGNEPSTTCTSHVVAVDTVEPELAFSNDQSPADPELVRVRASDATSGVAPSSAAIEIRRAGVSQWTGLPTVALGGELHARVDSGQFAPGEYKLRAKAMDEAGNWGATDLREDGEKMTLTLPLKERPALSATLGNGADGQTVKFRAEGHVEGRLVNSAGEPVVGAVIEITERFADGSLIDRRDRTVRTDSSGRYESLLPGGPSRNVSVSYPGSLRYEGAMSDSLNFDVRGAAKLRISKRRVHAGRAIAFRGRVKHYFARIPPGGKLVEIQVKSGRRWTTLQEAKGTDRKGKVRLRHRFRGFYTQPVTFTFRLKATRENGWPYRGAAKSARQKVTVVPKR